MFALDRAAENERLDPPAFSPRRSFSTLVTALLLSSLIGCARSRPQGVATEAIKQPVAPAVSPPPVVASSAQPPPYASALAQLNAKNSLVNHGEWRAQFDKLQKGHERHAPPQIPPPALYKTIKDPVFGSYVTRITDPSQWKGMTRIRHYYSKANPFNADNKLAVLFTSEGSVLLYDTASWSPIRPLKLISSDPEIQWHPTDPNVFYYMDFVDHSPNVRAMFRYDIRADASTRLHDFNDYDTARGKLEGNIDKNGRYYALIGMKGKDQREAFVYDIQKDELSKRVPVTEAMADDWISVSQSGKFVVMMGADRSRVYDIQMNHLRDLPKGSFGHADLCMTADGRDLMVYDGADHELDPNRNINIADLDTGKVSIGTRIGWGTTPHVSCRNIDFPGWALISTQGPDKDYPAHDFEIFWLKLDGSGEVRRVAHHHSDREEGGYFAEQHAVTNRDGTLIVFASNWGGSVIHDFLVRLTAP